MDNMKPEKPNAKTSTATGAARRKEYQSKVRKPIPTEIAMIFLEPHEIEAYLVPRSADGGEPSAATGIGPSTAAVAGPSSAAGDLTKKNNTKKATPVGPTILEDEVEDPIDCLSNVMTDLSLTKLEPEELEEESEEEAVVHNEELINLAYLKKEPEGEVTFGGFSLANLKQEQTSTSAGVSATIGDIKEEQPSTSAGVNATITNIKQENPYNLRKLRSQLDSKVNGKDSIKFIKPPVPGTSGNLRKRRHEESESDDFCDDELRYFDLGHLLMGPDPKKAIADYYCLCGFVFNNRIDFRRHIDPQYATRTAYGCERCTDRFRTQAELNLHKRYDH